MRNLFDKKSGSLKKTTGNDSDEEKKQGGR